ncbi:MAG: hypothetical protein JF595_13230 [Sphingomonadales bacterium]|nr:hypothetical protein [Sphingomonadales bacterium]
MGLRRHAIAVVLAAGLLQAAPASAGWKLIPAQHPVDLTGVTVTPQSDWNQASRRPGKQGQAWTHDGFDLNGLEFFAGVANGESLYRERNRKRNPMPKFDSGMLLPDLADFFERSFRAQIRLSSFAVVSSEPITFGGHGGLRVRYEFALLNDDLARQGEVRLAVVNRKLYAANFFAPSLHYFPVGLPEATAIMDSARF